MWRSRSAPGYLGEQTTQNKITQPGSNAMLTVDAHVRLWLRGEVPAFGIDGKPSKSLEGDPITAA
jgi:hypothetical protein